jgi:hypothetical protein
MAFCFKTLFAALSLCLLATSATTWAAGGGEVPLPSGPITLDGVLDSSYELIDEATYAAPDTLGVGQDTASDALGESSANVVWFDFGDANYLGFDDGSGLFVRNTGTADIQRLYVTWDAASKPPGADLAGERSTKS